MTPWRTLPVPMAPIMLSPPPELTVTLDVRFQAEASSGRSVPAGSEEGRSGGNLVARPGATASSTGSDQVRVRTSSRAVPEASPYSMLLLPVSHQLI